MENRKLRVLMLSQWYPLAMASYFQRAFKRREDVELRTCGPFTGVWIPWQSGMTLMGKYANPPTHQVGGKEQLNKNIPWAAVASQLGDWKPDLVIAVDAMMNWTSRPDVDCPVITIGTDPHCLQAHYEHARRISDYFFNMQHHYMKPGDVYLPYAFDPTVHYQTKTEKKHQGCMLGMKYPKRINLHNSLSACGYDILFETGPVFDEYRELSNSAFVGINYPSEMDLNARAFEIAAMGLVPLNGYVPDLEMFFNGVSTYKFHSIPDAVDQFKHIMANPEEAAVVAKNAHDIVWEKDAKTGFPLHSYDMRVQAILDTVSLC